MTKIAGLIQARMGSSRLPGKVMRRLAGQPLVGHIIDRLQATSGLEGIVLATTVDPVNAPLIAYAQKRKVQVYQAQGEDDIAERLHGAVRLTHADAILKINGDCPLVDPNVLSQLVAAFHANDDLDYVSNKIVWTWPEGLSAEAISKNALAWCDTNLTSPEDRELVANWIRDHPDRFAHQSIEGERDLTAHKWSVDTPEDFSFMTRIFDVLYEQSRIFSTDDVLALLERENWHETDPV